MGLYIKMQYYYIFLMCSPIFYYKPNLILSQYIATF